VPDASLAHRKEDRVPLKMFVNLSSSGDPSFELASTIDISCHGARVVTKEIGSPMNSCRFDRSAEISNLLAAWPIVTRIRTFAL
jgi:hypothetical protein